VRKNALAARNRSAPYSAMPKRPRKLKPIPTFRSDEEAAAFWMTHDTAAYLDLSKAQRVRFAKLRPSMVTADALELIRDVLAAEEEVAAGKGRSHAAVAKRLRRPRY